MTSLPSLGCQWVIRPNMPKDYLHYAKRSNILRLLESFYINYMEKDMDKHYVLFLRTEEVTPTLEQHYEGTVVRYLLDISIADHQNVRLIAPIKYEEMSWRVLSGSAIQEVQRRIKRWLKKH